MRSTDRHRVNSRRRPAWEREPLVGSRRADHVVVIAALVYRGVTTAEIELPVQRLSARIPADIVHVGTCIGPVPGVEPTRDVIVDATPGDVGAVDILIVPGGLGWRQVAADVDLASWLAATADAAGAVLAISTGSLLLAAAGRLAGHEATGHWLADADLAGFGATVASMRAVSADHGRLLTASGAHAALPLVDQVADRLTWAPDRGRRPGPRPQ